MTFVWQAFSQADVGKVARIDGDEVIVGGKKRRVIWSGRHQDGTGTIKAVEKARNKAFTSCTVCGTNVCGPCVVDVCSPVHSLCAGHGAQCVGHGAQCVGMVRSA